MASLTQGISSALVAAVDTVEVRSAWSPPYQAKTKDLAAAATAPGPTNPFLRLVKPVFILNGPIGPQVIAPAGVPEEDEWKRNLTAVAVVGGLLWLGSALAVFAFGVHHGRVGGQRRR